MGMRIIAVDGGDDKKKLCTDLGAEQYIDFTKEKDITAKVMEITTYGAHGVIVFSASKEGYQVGPSLVRIDQLSRAIMPLLT
jgi:propanol-preferring alcohol dehydrogenase